MPSHWKKQEADDIALLANSPVRAESLLHSQEQAAGGIVLYMNTNKTDCICLKQEGAITTLNGKL